MLAGRPPDHFLVDFPSFVVKYICIYYFENFSNPKEYLLRDLPNRNQLSHNTRKWEKLGRLYLVGRSPIMGCVLINYCVVSGFFLNFNQKTNYKLFECELLKRT